MGATRKFSATASDTYFPVSVVVRGRRVRLHLHFDDDGGFWVDSPDLRGLVTQGDSTDEAVVNGVDAALTLLEARERLRKRRAR